MADETQHEVQFRSDVSVELVRSSAQDADVLFAARVSTKGEQSLDDVDADASRSQGLINYLMRDRHGCYDDQTEVLTSSGWMRWPEVQGTESFATLSREGRIEYQRASRLVAKPHRGDMVRVRTAHVDLLVTPDHNMWAKRRRQPARESWELVPASDLLQASHRLALGGGDWEPDLPSLSMPEPFFALLGFFIGDGHTSATTSTPTFRLRKAREIEFIRRTAAECGFGLTERGDRFYLLADEDFRLFAKRCYHWDGSKQVPLDVMGTDAPRLRALLSGLMASDGSVSATGKRVYTTTSEILAGQVQEIALKLGEAASIRRRDEHDDSHLGSKPIYTVTLFRSRRATPRIGWTTQARAREVTVERYDGSVYCVTVPNGTLYVRRNGKALWCGNSPFEHNSMTFYVQAPIFVFREFMRHRVGYSYNEESGRYRELRPVFYVPGRDRMLQQQGKPGAYVFVEGTDEQHDLVEVETRRVCEEAYAAYQRMLAAGVAREVARIVLPVTIYSSMYVTLNARSMMSFLSLRTKREDSTFPSFPQREIEMCADKMEAEFARLMPLTHAAFDANGRVAP